MRGRGLMCIPHDSSSSLLPSLWPGWHVTANNVTAASMGDRAQALRHAEVCKDVRDIA